MLAIFAENLCMKLRQIIDAIEAAAPLALQESYDNSGLLLGNPDLDINGALIALDLTDEVLDEAISTGYNLIITHHPLIFHPLKKLAGENRVSHLIVRAIRHNVALYAAHTSLDNAPQGVSHFMAKKLGLKNVRALLPAQNKLMKLITFVPHSHADAVRQALFDAGAGHISRYDQCSFNTEGFGTFRGSADTSPFIGQPGQLSREPEIRIEVILPVYRRNQVMHALRQSHPYEEVAYDLVTLANDWQEAGTGVLGELPHPLSWREFLFLLRETFHARVIRHSWPADRPILRIALCGGAGSFALDAALQAGADAFATADISYHYFQEAAGRLLLCDIGHYESEQFTSELLLSILKDKLPTFAARVARQPANPVNYFA
ncbi:MAG: Nif3-like dinuclear metal center hexameric protein [Chitinophagales bacterium]|nr:Nif3-like dinuclear metal center hexameric protein [Chitinophagales bacterium]